MTARRNAGPIGTTLQGERIVLRCTQQSLLDQGFLHTNRAVLLSVTDTDPPLGPPAPPGCRVQS